MIQIFFLSLKDFLSPRFFKFAFLPLLFSFLLLVILSFFAFSYLFNYFDALFASDPNSWFAWFYNLELIKILFNALSFLSASFIIIFTSVFLSVFIISFLTPNIVNSINQKYYQRQITNQIPTKNIIFQIIKTLIKFIIIFVISLIFLFIPFINFLSFYIVFYYLFHKLMILDIASSVFDKDEFIKFYKNSSPIMFKISTFSFYVLSSMPFLGLFLQVFYVIFLTHLFYQKYLKLKAI